MIVLKRLCVVALFSLSSCQTIQLVSNYDEQTDQGVSALQKAVSEFLVEMQSTPVVADRTFGRNQAFYQRAAVDLNALQVRAQGIYKNQITIEQLDLAKENLAYLALLHKACITRPLDAAQKAAVKAQGVDTSPACRTQYGAEIDAPDRSGQVLNPYALGPLRSAFDSLFGAVMALELAKKRGAGDQQ